MTVEGWDPAGLIRDFDDPAGEAKACRTDYAPFDFSFVARAAVEGPDAVSRIGHFTRRHLQNLRSGQIRYALREDVGGHLIPKVVDNDPFDRVPLPAR